MKDTDIYDITKNLSNSPISQELMVLRLRDRFLHDSPEYNALTLAADCLAFNNLKFEIDKKLKALQSCNIESEELECPF